MNSQKYFILTNLSELRFNKDESPYSHGGIAHRMAQRCKRRRPLGSAPTPSIFFEMKGVGCRIRIYYMYVSIYTLHSTPSGNTATFF